MSRRHLQGRSNGSTAAAVHQGLRENQDYIFTRQPCKRRWNNTTTPLRGEVTPETPLLPPYKTKIGFHLPPATCLSTTNTPLLHHSLNLCWRMDTAAPAPQPVQPPLAATRPPSSRDPRRLPARVLTPHRPPAADHAYSRHHHGLQPAPPKPSLQASGASLPLPSVLSTQLLSPPHLHSWLSMPTSRCTINGLLPSTPPAAPPNSIINDSNHTVMRRPHAPVTPHVVCWGRWGAVPDPPPHAGEAAGRRVPPIACHYARRRPLSQRVPLHLPHQGGATPARFPRRRLPSPPRGFRQRALAAARRRER